MGNARRLTSNVQHSTLRPCQKARQSSAGPIWFRAPTMTAEQPNQKSADNAASRRLLPASRLLLLLAGYFVLQIGLRLITSNAADLDESEQLLATQHLQLGYGPQPPLYTWL